MGHIDWIPIGNLIGSISAIIFLAVCALWAIDLVGNFILDLFE